MIGVGVDIVKISRIEAAVQRFADRFLDRVFTQQEQHVRSQANCGARLAARFAAKEAVMKALRTGWAHGVRWIDVEVIGSGGPPRVKLHGQARVLAEQLRVRHIHISLAHEKECAVAFAVATTEVEPWGDSLCES